MGYKMDEIKKNRSDDVIFVLKPVEGKQTLNSMGVVDPRLFSGENRLHAVFETQTAFWYLKYDHGVVPEPFKQKFTSLEKLMIFVKDYFKKRNIEIAEIKD